MKRRLRWMGVLCIIPALVGIAAAAFTRYRRVQDAGALPTAKARLGDFSVIVRCRGELKARRSVQLTAPVNVPELRIVWLAPTGSSVEAGDPVIKFDTSAVKQQLQEKQAALKQAQAALDQAVAEARIAAEQNQIDLGDAQHKVEHARLEVTKGEILSALQAEENRIELGLSEKRLDIEKAKLKLAEVSTQARIASLRRARDKAKDELELTQYRLAQMELKAPSAGWVNYLSNFSQGWMNAKPFKVGDQAWPGAALAEIPDLSSLEMEGKIEEIDRGRIALGQEAQVRIDSLPEAAFPGRLTMLSPMTVMGWEWPPTRTFRGFAKLDKVDGRLRPGMNGRMDVVVNRIPKAISIPAKALFTVDGRPTVYLAERGGYQPLGVEVLARNPDEIAVKGLKQGALVALVEPEKKEKRP
ncbi:MAG: efflux RND transporter periplasmic adaptor subunit [Bryobacteraceae bacterium]